MIYKVGLSSVCEKWLQPCFDAKSLPRNKLVDIEQPKSLFLFSSPFQGFACSLAALVAISL